MQSKLGARGTDYIRDGVILLEKAIFMCDAPQPEENKVEEVNDAA